VFCFRKASQKFTFVVEFLLAFLAKSSPHV
jgi:hypothetical protein